MPKRRVEDKFGPPPVQPEIWLYVQGFDEKIADVLGSRKLIQEKQKQDYQFKSKNFLNRLRVSIYWFFVHDVIMPRINPKERNTQPKHKVFR